MGKDKASSNGWKPAARPVETPAGSPAAAPAIKPPGKVVKRSGRGGHGPQAK